MVEQSHLLGEEDLKEAIPGCVPAAKSSHPALQVPHSLPSYIVQPQYNLWEEEEEEEEEEVKEMCGVYVQTSHLLTCLLERRASTII